MGSWLSKIIGTSNVPVCSKETCNISLNDKVCQTFCIQHCAEWVNRFFVDMPYVLIPTKGWVGQVSDYGVVKSWELTFRKPGLTFSLTVNLKPEAKTGF